MHNLKILKNKKATDKVLSIYWFSILLIVSGAIVYMASVFYNTPYDIREVESDILANKISDCISEKGKIKENILVNGEFMLSEDNFLINCGLRFDTENNWNEIQYYTNVKVYSISDLNNEIYFFEFGNKNFAPVCNLNLKEKDNLVKCVERRIYSTDNQKNQYLIKIISSVRKIEKNA